jgi:hypothetical protein
MTPMRIRAAEHAAEIEARERSRGYMTPGELSTRLLRHAGLHRGLEPLLADQLTERARAVDPFTVARERAA